MTYTTLYMARFAGLPAAHPEALADPQRVRVTEASGGRRRRFRLVGRLRSVRLRPAT
jgi:hypothetical protein